MKTLSANTVSKYNALKSAKKSARKTSKTISE
nr:MAG TPA: hypothetical protein [Bacteriophage sp.]